MGGLCVGGAEEDVAEATAEALRGGALGEWDELRMPAMNGESPFVSSLDASLAKRGIFVRTVQSGECPYIPLPETWDEY